MMSGGKSTALASLKKKQNKLLNNNCDTVDEGAKIELVDLFSMPKFLDYKKTFSLNTRNPKHINKMGSAIKFILSIMTSRAL